MSQSYADAKAKRETRQRAHTAKRAANRKKFTAIARSLQDEIRSCVENCGLSKTAISVHSGVMPSTISHITRKYHPAARLETIVAVLRVAGYKIKIVPVDPKEDEYRSERRVSLPPV